MLQALRPAAAFGLLAVARLASALLRIPGASPGETYSGLEPVHFLLYRTGELGWEYGAGAALRSIIYPCLHAAVLAPIAAVPGQPGGRGATRVQRFSCSRNKPYERPFSCCWLCHSHHSFKPSLVLFPWCILADKFVTLFVLRCMLGFASAATSAWLYRWGPRLPSPAWPSTLVAFHISPSTLTPNAHCLPCHAVAGLSRGATALPWRTACCSSCASAPVCTWPPPPCCRPALPCTA